jgi:hypothetical protein
MRDIMKKLAELEASAPKVAKKKMLKEDSVSSPVNKKPSLKDMFHQLSETVAPGQKPLPVLDPNNKQAGMGFVTSNNPSVQNMLKNLDPKDVQIVQAPGQAQGQTAPTAAGYPAPTGSTTQPQVGQQVQEQDEDEDMDEGFFVCIGDEEDGGFVGMLTKEGGRWREVTISGTPPYKWGTGYMSYLTPDDIMQHIRNDFRHSDVAGPFSDEQDAIEYASRQYGLGQEQLDELSPALLNRAGEKALGQSDQLYNRAKEYAQGTARDATGKVGPKNLTAAGRQAAGGQAKFNQANKFRGAAEKATARDQERDDLKGLSPAMKRKLGLDEEQLDEISKKTSIAAYRARQARADDFYADRDDQAKADKTLDRIKNKFGAKTTRDAERGVHIDREGKGPVDTSQDYLDAKEWVYSKLSRPNSKKGTAQRLDYMKMNKGKDWFKSKYSDEVELGEEQLDEISQRKLNAYYKKAGDDARWNDRVRGATFPDEFAPGDKERLDKHIAGRVKSLRLAGDKLHGRAKVNAKGVRPAVPKDPNFDPWQGRNVPANRVKFDSNGNPLRHGPPHYQFYTDEEGTQLITRQMEEGAKVDRNPGKSKDKASDIRESKMSDIVGPLIKAFNLEHGGEEKWANILPLGTKSSYRRWRRGDGNFYTDPNKIVAFSDEYLKLQPKFFPWLTQQPGVQSAGKIRGEFRSSDYSDAVKYKGLLFVDRGSYTEYTTPSRLRNSSVWHQQVDEGAKVDRMVKHIEKSERDSGKSKEKASDIAWATANKRGMLDNKNKKKTNETTETEYRVLGTYDAKTSKGYDTRPVSVKVKAASEKEAKELATKKLASHKNYKPTRVEVLSKKMAEADIPSTQGIDTMGAGLGAGRSATTLESKSISAAAKKSEAQRQSLIKKAARELNFKTKPTTAEKLVKKYDLFASDAAAITKMAKELSKVQEGKEPQVEVVDNAFNRENYKELIGKKYPKSKAPSYARVKEVTESKKPDFLDLDKDGNKKEPMKKAAADKKKTVSENNKDIPYNDPEMVKHREIQAYLDKQYVAKDKKKKKVDESMNHRISAARFEGKSHGLKGHAHCGKAYEDLEERKSYCEGYKDGLDECYGMGVYEAAPIMPPATIGGMASNAMPALEDEFGEGNAFTAALANTPKGGKFSLGGRSYTDRSSIDEYAFESWDNQLNDLLNEGLSVSVSKGNNDSEDSVNINATGPESEQLMAIVKSAGLGLFGDDNADAHSSAMSVPSNDGMPGEVGAGSMDIDVVDGHDGMMGLMQKLSGIAPAGSEDYADEEDGESEEYLYGNSEDEEASCDDCGDMKEQDHSCGGKMDEEESEDQMEFEVSEDNPPDTGEAESTADEDAEAKEDAALAGEKEEEMNESFASMLARLDRLSESKDEDDEDEDEDEDSHKLLGAAGKAKKSFGKEQVDELSRKTLGSYVDKNTKASGAINKDLRNMYRNAISQGTSGSELLNDPEWQELENKSAKRAAGRNLANAKMRPPAVRVHANEGGYSGADAFKDKLSKSNDPFEMIYGAISGDFGDEIRKEMQAMYDDVVSDSRYHPDDDFEKIIQVMVDQLDNDSHNKGKEKVDEWANNAGPGKTVSDTTFERDIDFMTRVISGGLNKPKSTGQTTVPVIAGQDDRMHDNPKDWATLAGIKK